MRRTSVLMAAMVAMGFAASPAAAEMVVFEADAQGLSSGDKIADGTSVSLDAGETATLITKSGETYSLEGPYDGVPGGDSGAGASGTGQALAALVGEREASSDFLGATREVSFQRPDPWVVDARKTGKQCVRPGEAVTLWRPPTADDRDFLVRAHGADWKFAGTWGAEAETGEIPADAPIVDGRTFTIRVGGDAVDVTLRTVPAGLGTPRQQVAWMAKKGCDTQARLLAEDAGIDLDG